MPAIDNILNEVDDNLDGSVGKLLEFIAIPSISNDPSGGPGVMRAAEWLVQELSGIGFSARVVATKGHPVVLAHTPGEPKAGLPRLLFYGHYDVQPVGDSDQWKHAAFAPRLIEEDGLRRFYGRGASDSKSQHWAFIEAFRAWKKVEGEFPANITIMLEGEEESGSQSLPEFLAAHASELGCDVAFICDGEMWSRPQPAITTQLKGLVHERLTISGPNADLHSGHYGAVAANPIRILSTMLAGLHDEKGRVAIEGFYEGVLPIPPGVRTQWQCLDEHARLAGGVDLSGGVIEDGFSAIEAMWGRPTVDINGITGGNQGPGGRSVLPGSATARLTFRLVGGQEPENVRACFQRHIRSRLPEGCTVEFEGEPGSPAVFLSQDSLFLNAAARGLEAEWGQPTVLRGTGGAIPLVSQLHDQLNADCVVIGFILPDDAIHGYDERYDTERVRKGARSWVRILQEIRGLR